MENITVRPETAEDIRAIDVVNISAFQGEGEARLVTALREMSGNTNILSLVAEFNSRIVGHLMLSPVVIHQADQDLTAMALAPMSVVPSQSHRGIGSELVEASIETAKQKGYKVILVAGHPEFYRRFGFREASEWGITSNLPVPEDVLQVLELQPGVLHTGGNATYSAPFLECYDCY